jgi:nitrate reductase gamma subunit
VVLPYLAAAVFLIGVIRLAARRRNLRGGPSGGLQAPRWGGLRRADPVLALVAAGLHLGLAVILIRHLRYALFPVPVWVQALGGPGVFFGYLAAGLLVFLIFRRLTSRRLVPISRSADFLVLFLLLAALMTGLATRSFFRTDVIGVKEMVVGLIHFRPAPLETLDFFSLHFLIFLALIAIYPFSSLRHGLVFLLAAPLDREIVRRRAENARLAAHPPAGWTRRSRSD